MLGKTKEERKKTLAHLKKSGIQHVSAVDTAEMEAELNLTKVKEFTTAKRKEHGALRAKLGFNDKKSEVDDPILSQLEHDESNYQKNLKEKRERKPVKIVSDVKGISKEEYHNHMLREDEQFKDA